MRETMVISIAAAAMLCDRHILSEKQKQKKLTTNRISDVNFVAFAKNQHNGQTSTDIFTLIKKANIKV